VSESFQLPFGSPEERIAYTEAWSRSLNEHHATWAGREPASRFRCECWRHDCPERIRLTDEEWKLVRAEPNRFAVAPGHVAQNFEAVITRFPNFWLIDKFGAAGKVAEELARSDSMLRGPSA
jgi:hypothetical protein